MKENKIHVAFGFHVNCYHSYRGDTNDNLGFGSDIRIIGKILDTLTKFNEQGIPVKGTWDCENFFSLEKILPEYAPDIIEKMKERVKKYGDEQIIMGYSNGALGAMNEDEFTFSIENAVVNENHSGLLDIFGECAKIVRPQEVMFTPSQVSLYNKLGVKALCLYYSCVPFDAFRTLVKPLDDEIAFNPLTYTYKGESMTILPTYSNSDICDAGCLRKWVKDLRIEQINDEINNDLFIFINMDADGIFWEDMELPVKIANTQGIGGLVKEIADLDYVVFDTPSGYLKSHNPLGKIDFTQDTADGNFTGYASWSEKPYNRKIWTSIERSRAMSRLNSIKDSDSPSFFDRVLLLSTTHFGLATPVLNIQREKKADELAKKIIDLEKDALPKTTRITLHNINGTNYQTAQFKVNTDIKDISQIVISGNNLVEYTIVPMDDKNKSVFGFFTFNRILKSYEISVSFDPRRKTELKFPKKLTTPHLNMEFSSNGKLYYVEADGKVIGKGDFLQSFITYNGKKYQFTNEKTVPLSIGGNGSGVRLSGKIHLPGEITKGHFDFDFFTAGHKNGIYARTMIKYPYTPEKDSISTENSALGRFSDMNWQETAMFQITPDLKNDARVIKRNFMGDISSFRTLSFSECDSKNDSLDSFNHQLTAGMVGLSDGEKGLVIANSRQVLSSMAHCPMRLDKSKRVHMNMFGHYYGKQRHHFGRANDEILATYTLVTPQGKSIAPSYNGSRETAMLGFFGFSGFEPDKEQLMEITAFADGSVVTAKPTSFLLPFDEDNVTIKKPSGDGVNEAQLKNPIMTGFKGNLLSYITKGGKAIAHIIIEQIKSR